MIKSDVRNVAQGSRLQAQSKDAQGSRLKALGKILGLQPSAFSLQPLSRREGQATLETSLAVVCALLMLLASAKVFFWFSHRLIWRQRYFECSRGEAGQQRQGGDQPDAEADAERREPRSLLAPGEHGDGRGQRQAGGEDEALPGGATPGAALGGASVAESAVGAGAAEGASVRSVGSAGVTDPPFTRQIYPGGKSEGSSRSNRPRIYLPGKSVRRGYGGGSAGESPARTESTNQPGAVIAWSEPRAIFMQSV